jgi:probable F420-dependent oxidoreductase
VADLMRRFPFPLDVVQPFWFDRPPSEAFDIAANAERFGAHELWVGEMTTWDSFALAAAIARTTKRLELVCGPLAVKVRDPVALAMGVASVAEAGGRRAHLAVGASSPTVVEAWHGRRYSRMATAVEETVTTLRPLLGGHRGPGGYRLRLAPPGGELRVAVFGPRLTAFAATHADAVIINLCTPDQAARYRAAIDEAAAAAGVEPPRLMIWLMGCLDPGPASFAQAAQQLVAYLHPPGYGEVLTEAGFGELVVRARSGTVPIGKLASEIPDDLARTMGLVGSLDQIIDRMVQYRDAGIDRIGIAPLTADDHGAAQILSTLGALQTGREPNP